MATKPPSPDRNEVEANPKSVSWSSVAAISTSDSSNELQNAAEAVRGYAEAHPEDSKFRQVMARYGEALPKNRPFLTALAGYTTMEENDRAQVIEWIDLLVMPATKMWRFNSYSIKGDCEQAIGAYVNNEQFKGAMLVSGYMPAAGSAYEPDWRFRIKPAAPPHVRPAQGSFERGVGGFGLDARLFGGLRDLRRTMRQLGLHEAIQDLARRCGEPGVPLQD